MKRMLTRTTVVLLLLVYAGVGVAGHIQTLAMLATGDREARVTPDRVPLQKYGRVSVYQERHLPSPITGAAPEPAILGALFSAFRSFTRAAAVFGHDILPCRPAPARSPSRGPPASSS